MEDEGIGELENTEIGGLDVAAFCADQEDLTNQSVSGRGNSADPCKNWKFMESDRDHRLRMKNRLHILRSKEQIRVPPGIAIYCRANDETIGEMRIHYAGFVHPHFGIRDDGGSGTPLIFEVRGHQVDVSLRHGERMANLTLYRMSQEAEPDQSPYGNQTLKLSSFFSGWPHKLKKVGDDGTVEATDKTPKGDLTEPSSRPTPSFRILEVGEDDARKKTDGLTILRNCCLPTRACIQKSDSGTPTRWSPD